MKNDYENVDLSVKDCIIMVTGILASGLSVGYLFYDSLLVSCAVSCFSAALVPGYVKRKKEARRKELLLQFRDVLYSLSASVAVGRNMLQSIEESLLFWQGVYDSDADIVKELEYIVFRARECNEDDAELLEDLARRSGLEDIADFVTVYRNCRQTGGNMIIAINRAASIIGDKITMEKELEMMMGQKKFESRIILSAPFIMMLFLKVTAPYYLEPLTSSLHGYVVTTLSLVLIGAALIMTERINDIEI